MRNVHFIKMHGLGNDFVILDSRSDAVNITASDAIKLADRRRGIGCDQVILLKSSKHADAFMRIINSDGSESSACGNAARCVASLIMGQRNISIASIETKAGILNAWKDNDELISVDQGEPLTHWRKIPLARAMDTLHIDLKIVGANILPLTNAVGVNIGNPHAVFFVSDVEMVDLASLGPKLEHHPLFPERVNVSIAHLMGPNVFRARVWERGAGITESCGTAACAVAVAAVRRGLAGRAVEIQLDGGLLHILWREDDHILMTGPVAKSFEGAFNSTFFNE